VTKQQNMRVKQEEKAGNYEGAGNMYRLSH